jgi:hypothetical protein
MRSGAGMSEPASGVILRSSLSARSHSSSLLSDLSHSSSSSSVSYDPSIGFAVTCSCEYVVGMSSSCGGGGGGGIGGGAFRDACNRIGGDEWGVVGVGAVTMGVPGTGGGDGTEGAGGWPPTGFLVTITLCDFVKYRNVCLLDQNVISRARSESRGRVIEVE